MNQYNLKQLGLLHVLVRVIRHSGIVVAVWFIFLFFGPRNFVIAMDESPSPTSVPTILQGDDNDANPDEAVQAAIINGEDIAEGEAPWLAKLKVFWGDGLIKCESLCTGSVIHRDWILTAQHCLYPEDSCPFLDDDQPQFSAIEIGIGWSYVDGTFDRTISTDRQVLYPGYAGEYDCDSDIALLHLTEPLDSSIIGLDGVGTSIDKSQPLNTTAYGWGTVEATVHDNGSIVRTDAIVPQKAHMTIINADAERIDSRFENGSVITWAHQFTRTIPVDRVSIAEEDSGGPLITQSQSGEMVQVGISIAATEVGTINNETVTYPPGGVNLWVRVSDYAAWINHHIEKMTTPVSSRLNRIFGNDGSYQPAVSDDGRYVAFATYANNFFPDDGDVNSASDVYLRDMQRLGYPTLVSGTPDGNPANGGSGQPSISRDGRYVAFQSGASDLLPSGEDNNNLQDIFVFDREDDSITRISITESGVMADGGSSGADISANGRYVVFGSSASNLDSEATDNNSNTDIYWFDSGGLFANEEFTTTLVSRSTSSGIISANGSSTNPLISANGRYVLFQSSATNLVSNDQNNKFDVFMRDMAPGGMTIRVSVADDESELSEDSFPAGISADGRFVVFRSYATNANGQPDTNNRMDIFLRDTVDETTTNISRRANGDQSLGTSPQASMSDDGRYIAFSTND